jgi:hypothetical protein
MQIPISVAQGWLSGGDSPGANVDRSKPLGGVLLCFRAPLEPELDPGAWIVIGIRQLPGKFPSRSRTLAVSHPSISLHYTVVNTDSNVVLTN